MSQKFILYTFFLLLGSTLWMSNNAGYATVQFGSGTFAPNEISCKDCHTAGSASTIQTSTIIELIDTVTNKVVTSYQPKKMYKAKVTVNKVSGTPAAYGFQMVSLLNNGDKDVKGFVFPGAGVKIVELTMGLKRMYVEQTKKNTSNFFETKWVAPNTGSGSVTFYACGNGVNSNSLQTGDGASTAKLVVAEGTVSNVEISNIYNFSISPTIMNESVYYNIDLENAGKYNLKLISLDGNIVFAKPLELSSGNNQGTIAIENLSHGIYLMQITDGISSKTIKVLKD